jgi:hypothetical protein
MPAEEASDGSRYSNSGFESLDLPCPWGRTQESQLSCQVSGLRTLRRVFRAQVHEAQCEA